MSHDNRFEDEVFSRLYDLDLAEVRRVQAEGCPHCAGRLDRADIPRKVRGVCEGVERFFERRFGLCCARPGCRRRVLPASVRFLGRKVYAAVSIVMACVAEVAHRQWQQARRIARWLHWWREVFGQSDRMTVLRGRFAHPVDVAALPASLLSQFASDSEGDRLVRFLVLVSGRSPTAHEH